MSRALWLAGAVALTGCYPEFQFGDSGAGAGTTGRGSTGPGRGGDDPSGPVTSTSVGQGGDLTSSTMTSVTTGTGGGATTSSTGSMMVPTVRCGPPVSGQLHACGPDQVCCYDTSDPNADTCDTAGNCSGNAYELACDEPSDCPMGSTCCALQGEILGIPYFDGAIGCFSSCTYPNVPMCNSDADCGTGESCAPISDLDTDYGTDYQACQ